jgi:hypothetical protein
MTPMPINRSQSPVTARFTVGLNIVLTGSKNMTDEEQDHLMTVEKVRVLIVGANDEPNILLDEPADWREKYRAKPSNPNSEPQTPVGASSAQRLA